MSEYSSLSDLARFLGQAPVSGVAEGRRAVNDSAGRMMAQRPAKQRVSDLLSVVLTLSARTRRMILPKVDVELDVFAPGGERAVRMLLPE
jgi:hypothetical protein